MKLLLHHQRGATLIVALIVLVLLTLFAVTSFNLGKSSLQTVGNAQSRNEAMAAAQQTVEEAVSTTRLFETPGAVIVGVPACNGGAANTKCVDVNGDGNADITVKLNPDPVTNNPGPPTCISAIPTPSSELDLTPVDANGQPDINGRPKEAGCTFQDVQGFGVAGANTGGSGCSDSLWEVNAVAQDNLTGAQYSVTQGVGVRGHKNDVSTCP